MGWAALPRLWGRARAKRTAGRKIGTIAGALLAAVGAYGQGQVPPDQTVLVAKLMPVKQKEFCNLLHYGQDAEAAWQNGTKGMTSLQAAAYRRDHPDPWPRLAMEGTTKLQEFLGDGHFEDWVGILTVGHVVVVHKQEAIADTNFAFTCPGPNPVSLEIGTSKFGGDSTIPLDSPLGMALQPMRDEAWVKVSGQMRVVPAPRGGIPVASRNGGMPDPRHNPGPSLLADLTSIRPAR